MNRRGTGCSTIPAERMSRTNGAALPSMIGNSTAFTSTSALSTPKPANVAIRCSTVETLTRPLPRLVASWVSMTFSGQALTRASQPRSERTNTMPASAGAGRIVNSTSSPVCSPTPAVATSAERVLCLIKSRNPVLDPSTSGTASRQWQTGSYDGRTLLPQGVISPPHSFAPRYYPNRRLGICNIVCRLEFFGVWRRWRRKVAKGHPRHTDQRHARSNLLLGASYEAHSRT